MRIDGKDASTFSTADYNNKSDIVQKEIQIKQKEKPDVVDIRNLSRLSDFDKMELPISDKVVIEAIERANKAISGGNRRFEFSVHEKTKSIMIKVLDSDTNEVIREIPPEKILDMVAKIWEMAGLIVDERR